MSHKISILFPLLGLSCAQQFNHGMFPIHQGASTSQEQGRQAYGATGYDQVAQQEYDRKLEKAFQTVSFKDIHLLAQDCRLASCFNVELLLSTLCILIPSDHEFAENTCELLISQLLALEASGDYKRISQPNIAKEGLTLLQLAIQYKRTGIALKLINKFKEVSESKRAAIINTLGGSTHRTALHIAVQKNDVEIVKQLLAVPGIDINAKDKMGIVPCYLAMFRSNQKIVDLLRGNGAKVDNQAIKLYKKTNLTGSTRHRSTKSEEQAPYDDQFMNAGRSGKVPEICRLAKDPRVHKLRNIRGIIYALYYILRAPHSDDNVAAAFVLTDRFVEEKDFRSQEVSEENGNMCNYAENYSQFLKLAMKNNYEKIVEKLITNIEKQENSLGIINYKENVLGEPLLHYLINLKNQNEEKKNQWIQMLLNVPGINLDIQDNSGCTPLQKARKLCNDAVVTLLLNKGATVNVQDKSGLTSFGCVGRLQSQSVQGSVQSEVVELFSDVQVESVS